MLKSVWDLGRVIAACSREHTEALNRIADALEKQNDLTEQAMGFAVSPRERK
jgi:hypothetical protein